MLTVGSLFSGIGGLDLGLERAGMRVLWQCESDPYCRAVLRKHWPNVPCYEDVKTLLPNTGSVDGRQIQSQGQHPAVEEPREFGSPGRVDVLCGGFPCQPVSLAGRRKGNADERWLWPEFARLIRLLRPRYALMENVPGLLAGGGMAEVLGDLAACGYDAEWDCIPAAAVGAPHLRFRVFIVAYADARRCRTGRQGRSSGLGEGLREQALPDTIRGQLRDEPRRRGGASGQGAAVAGNDGAAGFVADTAWVQPGRAQQRAERERTRSGGESIVSDTSGERLEGRIESDAARRTFARPPRRSGQWLVEPNVGRVAHGVPSRVDRLRALGNAVVPQVAEYVGRQIVAWEEAS